jgi:hypothetical protein
MDVINLILQNLNIVIILAVALGGYLISRLSNRPTQAPMMPPFGNPSGQSGQSVGGKREAMPTIKDRSTIQDSRSDFWSRTEEVDSRPTLQSNVAKTLEEPIADNPAIKLDDAMRGVVWAEVLGPPRSKRPYQRR